MAAKVQCRNYRDKNMKQSSRPVQNDLPDEIALRDEIFQLKRQILMLKKANERNVIKVRKYEDEAKKKDREIEHLMDPVKNGDVRKLLSTKGAALLLNLREQNDTLIQMILDKDIQIRKLLSEIKTSKLYAGRRNRTESYRNEIDRLRNLLVKSQGMMKEVQDTPQRRSICVGGTPSLELTLTSEQSSPRDLEELQFTIQNLEMHMKYSNELLAKKNEQIVQLTEQLNSRCCDICRQNLASKYVVDVRNYADSRTVDADSGVNTGPREVCNSTALFDRTNQDKKRLPNSAPAGPIRSARDDTPRRDSSPNCKINTFTLTKDPKQFLPSKDERRRHREGIKSMEDIMTGEEIWLGGGVPENNASESSEKPFHPRMESRTPSQTDSDIDTEEFEMMEKKIENDQVEIESPVKLVGTASGEKTAVEVSESPPEEERHDKETEAKRENDYSQPEVEVNVIPYGYRPNRESSFDSETTTGSTCELEVEAEINQDNCDDEEKPDSEDCEDDDDDVVVG